MFAFQVPLATIQRRDGAVRKCAISNIACAAQYENWSL